MRGTLELLKIIIHNIYLIVGTIMSRFNFIFGLNIIFLCFQTHQLSLVTRRQNLRRKEFKRTLESEAHPCKRFLDKPVDHGHNLRSCKTNPAHLRIPVSRTVRHKQSFIPRGAKLNLIWYVYIICSVLNFYCNITVILIAKGNRINKGINPQNKGKCNLNHNYNWT